MWAQIANAKSQIKEEPAARAEADNQVAQLIEQDQQLAKILEEEMTHREQVSVLSCMHLQQVEEVKSQSQEIRRLLALVEQQELAIEKLTSPQNPPWESRAFQSHSEAQLDDMREEIFNLIPGAVNTVRGTAVSHNTTVASVPRISQTFFEDMLAEEANVTPGCQPKHDVYGHNERGVTSSTPQKYQEEVVSPSRPVERSHPEDVGLHAAACKFPKMWEPKISKLKGGYSSSAGLIFQSWLKDIHVEDRQLMQREAIQLVKDFTADQAQDEVELYMCMVAEEDQSFEGLIDHLCDAFQLGETLSELISDFYGQSQKTQETEDTFADDLQVLARKFIAQKPSFRKEANQQLKAQYVHKPQDQNYAAMAHSALQSSPEEESFMRFLGCLVMMFGGHARQS